MDNAICYALAMGRDTDDTGARDDGAGPPTDPSVDPPTASFTGVAIERCPYCDYELAGLRERRCPECGEEITDADVRLDARRRVFLELTRGQVVWGNLLLLVVCVFTTMGIAVIPYLLGIAAVRLLPDSGGKGVVKRVRRRAWLLAIGRLYSPWVVVMIGLTFFWMNFYWYGDLSVVGWVMEYLGSVGTLILVLMLYLGCVVLWRQRLGKVAKIAGLTPGQIAASFPRRGWATRLAIGPVLVVLLALVAVGLLMPVIQRVFPNWGGGF